MNKSKDLPTCEWVQEHLVQYEDGELDGHVSQQVAQHLQMCGRCATEAAAFAQLKSVLHQLPETKVSPAFASQVVAAARRISSAEKTISFAEWWQSVQFGWRMATVVGAAVALMFGFILGTTLLSREETRRPHLYFFANGHSSLTDTYQRIITGQGQR